MLNSFRSRFLCSGIILLVVSASSPNISFMQILSECMESMWGGGQCGDGGEGDGRAERICSWHSRRNIFYLFLHFRLNFESIAYIKLYKAEINITQINQTGAKMCCWSSGFAQTAQSRWNFRPIFRIDSQRLLVFNGKFFICSAHPNNETFKLSPNLVHNFRTQTPTHLSILHSHSSARPWSNK